MPWTTQRWKKTKISISGTLVSVDRAMIEFQSRTYSPKKAARPTVSVWALGVSVSTTARRYSFHAPMKAKVPTPTRPGTASGRMTAQRARSRVHPSTMAASSSSTGTESR